MRAQPAHSLRWAWVLLLVVAWPALVMGDEAGILDWRLNEGRGVQMDTAAISVSEDRFDPELGAAVRQAVQWHPQIAQAAAVLQGNRQEVDLARAQRYPEITLSSSSDVEAFGEAEAVRLSASQTLYSFGRISRGIDAARARQSREEAAVLLEVDEVARAAARAYVEVQRLTELMAVGADLIDRVEHIVNLARSRAESGAAAESDATQALARLQSAQSEQWQTRSRLQTARVELAAAVGETVPVRLTDAVPAQLTSACEPSRYDPSVLPAVKQARAELQATRAEHREAQASRLPSLSLELSYDRAVGDDPLLVDGSRRDRAVTLNLSTTVFEGFAGRARTGVASAAERSASAGVSDAHRTTRELWSRASQEAAELWQRQTLLEARAETIEEVRERYLEQYLSLGVRSILDLLNSEQEIQQARQELINARYDLRALHVECLFASGRLRDSFDLEHTVIQGVELVP